MRIKFRSRTWFFIGSGFTTTDISGIQSRVADVEAVQDIGHESLQSQSVTAVRTTSESSLICIPVVTFSIDFRSFVSLF